MSTTASKGMAKVIDPKDLSPAWKVLQMKIKEELEEKKREEALNPKKEEPKEDDGFTKVLSKKMRQRENRKRKAQEALIEASASKKSSSAGGDIPVLIKDDEKGEPTDVMALDCEYVGAGPDGSRDILARISIVNDKGKIVYNKYVKPTEKITDYRTHVSGIRPEDLKKSITFETAQNEVTKLIEGKTIVGHAVHNDFRVMRITHGRKLTRDTAKCIALKVRANQPKGILSLKKLAKEVLGIDIQQGEHDSITDARVALKLYETVKKQWEAEIKRYRT